jgi:hypothetical protein
MGFKQLFNNRFTNDCDNCPFIESTKMEKHKAKRKTELTSAPTT